jgi:hypothetical protein
MTPIKLVYRLAFATFSGAIAAAAAANVLILLE